MAGSDASQIGGPGTTTDHGVRVLHRAAEWVAGAAEMLAVTADSVGRQLELGMSKEMAAAYLEHPKIEVQSNSARAAVLRKYIYIETLLPWQGWTPFPPWWEMDDPRPSPSKKKKWGENR